MKRLEHTRIIRGRIVHAKNPTEAVMHLAQFARERHRLQQERSSLAKRLERIEARLTEIAGSETRLAPLAQFMSRAAQPVTLPDVRDAMLQY